MESPRKFNDCYFYYYSTCTKGDNCVFRHEPSALGCETMCALWQEGKCLDKKCKYRHMELRKNRKQIPCYWENQPGGCRKKHCPFMHKNPDARTDGIAPSQPILSNPMQAQNSVGEPAQVDVMPHPGLPHQGVPHSGVPHPGVAPVPMPSVPAPVPLLWQQQRQVVLDSTILGVLPTSADLLGGRRVMPSHESTPNPYGPMPVDPLVVNFEEESDNETPSGTPTKQATEGPADISDSTVESHELLLLEKIQAEAAAFYSYDQLPPRETPKERKLVRANLSTKYDRLSLDELAGKKNTGEKITSLDFKVMSLDEIRAKKRTSLDAIVHSASISVNVCRKRKASETIVDSTNKIIKVVRSNSIVYKKVDESGAPSSNVAKVDQKAEQESKKRNVLEFNDSLDVGGDELEDDCFNFKKIRPDEIDQSTKTPFIRTISEQIDSFDDDVVETISIEQADVSKADSDDEVQIVSEETHFGSLLGDSDVIHLDDSLRTQSEIVDLSDEDDEDIIISDIELSFGKNVPDVVASCHSKTGRALNDSDVLDSIHDILDEDL